MIRYLNREKVGYGIKYEGKEMAGAKMMQTS
jgi:hypothetical protein